MDITPEYVKMCEKAEEIQRYSHSGVFLYPEKQYWAQPHYGQFIVDSSLGRDGRPYGAIWIPRQDQLQAMVLDTDAITTEFKFHGWIITSNYIPIGLPQLSMEQLWLAFVMWELYKKKWDGTTWGNEGGQCVENET